MINCQDNVKEAQNDSGEFKEEAISIDKRNGRVKRYYKNGQLAYDGKYLYGKRNGYWEEWYIDGMVKWQGHYLYGYRFYKPNDQRSIDYNLKIEDDPDKLNINISYHIRMYISGIHPDDIIVASNNGTIIMAEDRKQYDFVITPKNTGILTLYVYTRVIDGQEALLFNIQLEVGR